MEVFISYAWESNNHREWVEKFAESLEKNSDIEVTFDRYDLNSLIDKNAFMEKGIIESDYVLAIITDEYTKKANERIGGVGIETSLASARHWDELTKIGKSRVIPILREKQAKVPHYLNSKFHLDFTDNNNYENQLKTLLELIRGKSNITRPQKKNTSTTVITKSSNFTRVDDLIKHNFRKREIIVNGLAGTDFSSDQRIKFEIWRGYNPRENLIVILFPNITLSQTIERVCKVITEKGISSKDVLILRPDKGENGYLQKLFDKSDRKLIVTELTYSEFIWDYCLDEQLKEPQKNYSEPFFVNQEITWIDEFSKEKRSGTAIELLLKSISDENAKAVTLVLAPGGSGKTTLCHELLSRLSQVPQTISIFIQASQLYKGLSKQQIEKSSVRSIFDLYELYALSMVNTDEHNNSSIDRSLFDILVACGNLVVVVDGIDELVNLFQDRFDKTKFVLSLIELDNQLAKARVLLTSREESLAGISEVILEQGIASYQLEGFNQIAWQQYIRKRFSRYDSVKKEGLVNQITTYLHTLISTDIANTQNVTTENTVLPFFVDLLCSSADATDGKLEINDVPFPDAIEGGVYRTNRRLTDYLVYQSLRREVERQSLPLTIQELADLFKEFSVELSGVTTVSRFDEVVEMYFGARNTEIAKTFHVNPLLSLSSGIIKFKYDFLNQYFSSLYVIDGLTSESEQPAFYNALAKLSNGRDQIFNEVQIFVSNNYENIIGNFTSLNHKIVTKIKTLNIDKSKTESKYVLERCVSALIHLALKQEGRRSTKSENIERLINISGEMIGHDNRRKIEYLSIFGDLPALDLTNLEFWHCNFRGYENLTQSKYSNTRFYYCNFDGINGTNLSPSFDPLSFDKSSCKLGSLNNLIDNSLNSFDATKRVRESDVRIFFEAFLERGIAFRYKKPHHLRLSIRSGIDDRFIKLLLDEGYLIHDPLVKDAIGVSPNMQKSIYSFVRDNVIDMNIAHILSDF